MERSHLTRTRTLWGKKTFQRAYSDIKVAKGNATEEAVCYSLKDQFSSIETQRKIDLEKNTYTKSDIIATHANQNIQIGDISIKEGESMGVEVKCGEAAYLSSQISHIDKQLSGFDVYERQDESVKVSQGRYGNSRLLSNVRFFKGTSE